jgi:hypothetical protein
MTGRVKTDFPPQVTERYEITGELGHGAYGIVWYSKSKSVLQSTKRLAKKLL